jgi:hypothetical protein
VSDYGTTGPLALVGWIAGTVALAYIASKPQDRPVGDRAPFIWLVAAWVCGPPLAIAVLVVIGLF